MKAKVSVRELLEMTKADLRANAQDYNQLATQVHTCGTPACIAGFIASRLDVDCKFAATAVSQALTGSGEWPWLFDGSWYCQHPDLDRRYLSSEPGSAERAEVACEAIDRWAEEMGWTK